MNASLVDQVVNAVLYEGYMLYPYRPSSAKNRTRFTFGRVYPEAYSISQHGAEPFIMQTECLVQSASAPAIEISVRFAPNGAQVGALATASAGLLTDAQPEPVPELRVDGRRVEVAEAVERTVVVPSQPLKALVERAGAAVYVSVFAHERADPQRRRPCRRSHRKTAGSAAGRIEVAAASIDTQVFKVSVRVVNQTPIPESELNSQNAVILRTFASMHAILCAQDGEFLRCSIRRGHTRALPAPARTPAYPVLVGDEKRGSATRCFLADHSLRLPAHCAREPGDLFDGTEIDEILTLRVMAMTDAENPRCDRSMISRGAFSRDRVARTRPHDEDARHDSGLASI
jgi:hydrogenase maturation protease